jgi:serine/threonine-protein kinase
MELDPATAFAVFDQQDSGCISYGVESAGRRLFVKTARKSAARASLGRAIRFHRSVRHPAIVAPVDVVDTDAQRTLVYPWRDGVVLNQATVHGSDRSGLDRFRQLPAREILAAVDTVFAAHEAIAGAGFVSVDLYDGCFLYDFDRHAMQLIDLDEYRPAPFTVEGDRLPGSTRYMAPEERVPGAVIDERTTVFHLGRAAVQLLGGSNLAVAQEHVVATATDPDRENRYPNVRASSERWRAASSA